MRAQRPIAIAAGIASIALASLLVASPAAGATLPSGQRITTTNNVDTGEDFVTQSYEASPADASTTLVGTAQSPTIVEGIDVDQDGHGYAVLIEEIDGPAPGIISVLRPYDANTGILGPGVPITPVNDIDINACRGIDLMPDGTIVIACNYFTGESISNSYLGTVTPEGDFTDFLFTAGDGLIDFRAVAYNAVNGELWAFGYDSVQDPISVQVDYSGPDWFLDDPFDLDDGIESADFDRDGQLFVVWLPGEDFPHLGTNVPGSNVITDIGNFTEGGEEIGMRTITVWGKAALPATGPTEIVPIGLGTALLLLAGAAFVATSRIQRKADA